MNYLIKELHKRYKTACKSMEKYRNTEINETEPKRNITSMIGLKVQKPIIDKKIDQRFVNQN